MRTVDVARRAGCSIQQVRKLEAAGVLPPAPRTTSGYRQYHERHAASLLVYQQLAAAIGPVQARLLLRDAHRDESAMLARLDAATHGCTRNAANSSSPGRHCGPSATSRWPTFNRQTRCRSGNSPLPSAYDLPLCGTGKQKNCSVHVENGTGLAATVRLMSATLASSTSYVRRATGSHHCGICCPHFAVNTTGMSCSPTAITASKPGPGRCWAAPQPLPHSWGTAAEHLNLEPACPRAIRPGGSVRWCRVRLPTRPGN